MAEVSASTSSNTTHDGSRPVPDPFWHLTPRTNSSTLSLFSAVEKVVPAPSTMSAPPQKITRQAISRRPQCTHITMKRLYGDFACSMCGRVPEVRWVYACQQDHLPGQYDPLPDVDAIAVAVSGNSDFFDAKARVAEYLQMSPSIIRNIRSGFYDIDHVDRLLDQREQVIRTINDQEARLKQGSVSGSANSFAQSVIASVGITAPVQNCRNSLPMSPAGTPANTPHQSHPTTPVKFDPANSRYQQNCTFQVCHACRPFFQDRMYATFESVLSCPVLSPSAEEWRNLPIRNARIIAGIGKHDLPQPPPTMVRSQPSMDIVTQSMSELEDDISVDWSDSDSPSERLDSSELYPCPGPGQCPVWSRQSGCAYETGFDDGRRALNHGFFGEMDMDRVTPETSRSQLRLLTSSITNTPIATSSTASSLSLPTPTSAAFAPLFPTDDVFDVALQKQLSKSSKAQSVSGEFDARSRKVGLRSKHSSSSLGSEVEVEGGVALTEEAVESGTPDIITSL